MPENEYISVELPGVGEIRGRPGTSTIELAGAAKFWFDKYQDARTAGIIAGVSIVVLLEILAGGVYFLLRN